MKQYRPRKWKSERCRYGLHEMTPENTKIEKLKVRGRTYECRRCKACQKARTILWYNKRREKLCATMPSTPSSADQGS